MLDVGGYFAGVLDHLCAQFSGKIAGVVEDTENGHQRYAELDKLPCPVFSVARSPLKDPEDYLVGQSVVFSTDRRRRRRDRLRRVPILFHQPSEEGAGRSGRRWADGAKKHLPRAEPGL